MVESLESGKLWMVTGKGGVGKTTLAAALGILSAEAGHETLLVETHGLHHLGELFGVGEVGYRPKKIAPHLSLCQITPREALEEYLLEQIKVRLIYNAVFKNRYVQHFLEAAPGLVELLTIGKIWALTQEKGVYGNPKTYGRIIVDAPSTGHGLSLLTVPEVVVRATRVGPLKTKSENILKLIRDPQQTRIWLATLAEEMPVTEAIEMVAQLKSKAKVPLGPLMINALWPNLLSSTALKELGKGQGDSAPMVGAYENRLRQSRYYVDKLKSHLPQEEFLELPLVYKTSKPLEIAGHLAKFIQSN